MRGSPSSKVFKPLKRLPGSVREVKVKPSVKSPVLIRDRGKPSKLRPGRGFSIRELESAGLKLEDAKRMGIPVDPRRRSCHEWNVELLKEIASQLSRRDEKK